MRNSTNKMLFEPIKRILVANKGEIAVRISRTCEEMGIVAKEIDEHSDTADIIRIAKENQFHAIHPGYGFLSERPDFAQAVQDSGLRFIGPDPKVLRQVSDQSYLKKVAKTVEVPVVPGTCISNYESVQEICMKIGLPVILKPARGKCILPVIVRNMDEIEEKFFKAASNAAALTGSNAIQIERFLEQFRRIEVPFLADKDGNLIHLYDRDVSLRFPSKSLNRTSLIGMAPAPDLKPEVTSRMRESAIKIAKQLDYLSAGSVEFLYDHKKNEYFFGTVKVNLQAEHSLTEEITGIDIVHVQIRLAEGLTLPEIGITPANMSTHVHAVQCCITTEDPTNNLQPNVGKIEEFRTAEGIGIRLDRAVSAGSVISSDNDCMVAKVVARAPNLKSSISRMKRALNEIRVEGIKTNVDFLSFMFKNEMLADGWSHPNFLNRNVERFVKQHGDSVSKPKKFEPFRLNKILTLPAKTSEPSESLLEYQKHLLPNIQLAESSSRNAIVLQKADDFNIFAKKLDELTRKVLGNVPH